MQKESYLTPTIPPFPSREGHPRALPCRPVRVVLLREEDACAAKKRESTGNTPPPARVCIHRTLQQQPEAHGHHATAVVSCYMVVVPFSVYGVLATPHPPAYSVRSSAAESSLSLSPPSLCVERLLLLSPLECPRPKKKKKEAPPPLVIALFFPLLSPHTLAGPPFFCVSLLCCCLGARACAGVRAVRRDDCVE
jgi:hypothetical protein